MKPSAQLQIEVEFYESTGASLAASIADKLRWCFVFDLIWRSRCTGIKFERSSETRMTFCCGGKIQDLMNGKFQMLSKHISAKCIESFHCGNVYAELEKMPSRK
jgi:hypothetical protein